mgnify:FL=1
MILTPFGDLIYGDNKGIKPWMFAHEQRHRTELKAIAFRSGVALPYSNLAEHLDDDWFQRHAQYHLSMLRFFAPDDSVSTQMLTMQWDDAQNFQVWHQMHNDLHSHVDESLGISNAT